MMMPRMHRIAAPLSIPTVPLLKTVRAVLVIAVVCTLPPIVAASELTMKVTDTSVVVNGATPNRDVVLFGVARHARGHLESMRVHRSLAHASATGSASWDAAVRGSWLLVAVDQQSGRYVISSARPPQRAAQSIFLQRDGAPTIESSWLAFELLVVRPGVGAWVTSGNDGGPSDADKSLNASTRLLLSQTETLAGNAPLATVKRGDLVFAVEPFSLDFYTAEVR